MANPTKHISKHKLSKTFNLTLSRAIALSLVILCIPVGAATYDTYKENQSLKKTINTAANVQPKTESQFATPTHQDLTPESTPALGPSTSPSKASRCASLEASMPPIYQASEADAYDLYVNTKRLLSERTDLTDDEKKINTEVAYTKYQWSVKDRYDSIRLDFINAGCTPTITLSYRPA